MSTYAVGDVQGCLEPLRRALDAVQFDTARDRLWLTGDLVNRGSDSLGVLRLVRSLGSAATVVLGNHDLHLIAVALGVRPPRKKDTFDDVLSAPDRAELIEWLRQQPLLHHDTALGFALTHAGVPPQWTLTEAQQRAREVEDALRGATPEVLLANMYGDEPRLWGDDLVGPARLRLITNYFTRMRFCSPRGELDMTKKHEPSDAPPGMAPWFTHAQRKTKDDRLIFGHWATLRGNTQTPNAFGLDTGCVYGGDLTVLHLETERRVCLPCQGQWLAEDPNP
jgi:bis(5'-nucleosyl)-tetraphosphatase (symmetrical)